MNRPKVQYSRKKINFVFLFVLVWILFKLVPVLDGSKPEQVHINLGPHENEVVISWASMKKTSNPMVQYGTDKTQFKDKSNAEEFYFSLDKFYTYRALIKNLKPDTIYYYQVGSSKEWSKTFQFKTFKSGSNWLPYIVLFGDLGWQNYESYPYLIQELPKTDIMFHVGDMAYDLHERNGEKGNDFMRSVEPMLANVFYMVCPGNHERTDNFTHYDSRFSMLGDYLNPKPNAKIIDRINNHYHSIDVGPVHIIMFSTEFYYYTQWGWEQIHYQYKWLVEDLEKANRNRIQRPWIVVMGHRALYCLRLGDKSCDNDKFERPDIREGLLYKEDGSRGPQYGLEYLFYHYGVDLEIYAHEHYYARMAPIFNHKIQKGMVNKNMYVDPMAPVQLITGSAGNREVHPTFNPDVIGKDFLVARSEDYGYSRMYFKSKLHMVFEQTSIDEGNIVVDSFEYIKTDNYPKFIQ